MPHRVTSFFRSSTENISTTATAIKTAARRRDSGSRSRPGRVPREGERSFSYASSISDDGDDSIHAVRMPEAAETAVLPAPLPHSPALAPAVAAVANSHKKHRLSLPFGRSGRDSHENAVASLDWKIESPPIVFYGDAENSTGALVSGQLFLTIKEDAVEVDSFDASLNIHVVQKRPFTSHCYDCGNQFTELKHWNFLTHPTTLQRGTHQFPFSILLGGHLPSSTETPIMTIAYEFKAEALMARSPTSSTSSCAPIKFEKVLDVKRSLPEPDTPHHSVRVFPPTNIKASAHYDQVAHPTSKHTMTLRLDGLTSTNHANNTTEFWKLKKIAWRLEENIKTIAPACEKHMPANCSATTTSKKGLPRAETRVLGEKTTFDGWKADYSNDGVVDYEFEYGVSSHRHGSGAPRPKYACDTKSLDGTDVSHTLMIEMVVSKEWCPVGKPHLTTQTGTGRILRMHYSVAMSEFPGMGVSWDNEAPPLYQDVPPSPPTYPDESPIDYDSLEPLEAARSSSVER